jgi:hypothetical protein
MPIHSEQTISHPKPDKTAGGPKKHRVHTAKMRTRPKLGAAYAQAPLPGPFSPF